MGLVNLTKDNYHSKEADLDYFSVSQFKAFRACEAGALADLRGEYPKETTTALLVGSYVDAYFAGTLGEFRRDHPEILNSRTGALKADFKKANDMIARLERCNLIMSFMSGKPQVIMTAELFGYPWKIMMDFYDGEKIVDLKTVKDFGAIFDDRYRARRGWVEYWGYDLQGAIYQRVEQIVSGRKEPLPFYIAAVTKEDVPDIGLFQIPQYQLDSALKAWGVEDLIDRYDLIKTGDIKPHRCECCKYCKTTREITAPVVYEMEEV